MTWNTAENWTTDVTLRYGQRTKTVSQGANFTDEIINFAKECGLKKGFCLPCLS